MSASSGNEASSDVTEIGDPDIGKTTEPTPTTEQEQTTKTETLAQAIAKKAQARGELLRQEQERRRLASIPWEDREVVAFGDSPEGPGTNQTETLAQAEAARAPSGTLEEVRAKMGTLKTRYDERSQELNELIAQHSTVSGEYSTKKAKYEEILGKIGTTEEERAAKEQEFADLLGKSEAVKGSILLKEKEIAELSKQIVPIASGTSSIWVGEAGAAKVGELTKTAQQKQDELAALGKEMSGIVEQATTTKTSLENIYGTLSATGEEGLSLYNELTGRQGKLEELSTRGKSISEEILGITQEYNPLIEREQQLIAEQAKQTKIKDLAGSILSEYDEFVKGVAGKEQEKLSSMPQYAIVKAITATSSTSGGSYSEAFQIFPADKIPKNAEGRSGPSFSYVHQYNIMETLAKGVSFEDAQKLADFLGQQQKYQKAQQLPPYYKVDVQYDAPVLSPQGTRGYSSSNPPKVVGSSPTKATLYGDENSINEQVKKLGVNLTYSTYGSGYYNTALFPAKNVQVVGKTLVDRETKQATISSPPARPNIAAPPDPLAMASEKAPGIIVKEMDDKTYEIKSLGADKYVQREVKLDSSGSIISQGSSKNISKGDAQSYLEQKLSGEGVSFVYADILGMMGPRVYSQEGVAVARGSELPSILDTLNDDKTLIVRPYTAVKPKEEPKYEVVLPTASFSGPVEKKTVTKPELEYEIEQLQKTMEGYYSKYQTRPREGLARTINLFQNRLQGLVSEYNRIEAGTDVSGGYKGTRPSEAEIAKSVLEFSGTAGAVKVNLPSGRVLDFSLSMDKVIPAYAASSLLSNESVEAQVRRDIQQGIKSQYNPQGINAPGSEIKISKEELDRIPASSLISGYGGAPEPLIKQVDTKGNVVYTTQSAIDARGEGATTYRAPRSDAEAKFFESQFKAAGINYEFEKDSSGKVILDKIPSTYTFGTVADKIDAAKAAVNQDQSINQAQRVEAINALEAMAQGKELTVTQRNVIDEFGLSDVTRAVPKPLTATYGKEGELLTPIVKLDAIAAPSGREILQKAVTKYEGGKKLTGDEQKVFDDTFRYGIEPGMYTTKEDGTVDIHYTTPKNVGPTDFDILGGGLDTSKRLDVVDTISKYGVTSKNVAINPLKEKPPSIGFSDDLRLREVPSGSVRQQSSLLLTSTIPPEARVTYESAGAGAGATATPSSPLATEELDASKIDFDASWKEKFSADQRKSIDAYVKEKGGDREAVMYRIFSDDLLLTTDNRILTKKEYDVLLQPKIMLTTRHTMKEGYADLIKQGITDEKGDVVITGTQAKFAIDKFAKNYDLGKTDVVQMLWSTHTFTKSPTGEWVVRPTKGLETAQRVVSIRSQPVKERAAIAEAATRLGIKQTEVMKELERKKGDLVIQTYTDPNFEPDATNPWKVPTSAEKTITIVANKDFTDKSGNVIAKSGQALTREGVAAQRTYDYTVDRYVASSKDQGLSVQAIKADLAKQNIVLTESEIEKIKPLSQQGRKYVTPESQELLKYYKGEYGVGGQVGAGLLELTSKPAVAMAAPFVEAGSRIVTGKGTIDERLGEAGSSLKRDFLDRVLSEDERMKLDRELGTRRFEAPPTVMGAYVFGDKNAQEFYGQVPEAYKYVGAAGEVFLWLIPGVIGVKAAQTAVKALPAGAKLATKVVTATRAGFGIPTVQGIKTTARKMIGRQPTRPATVLPKGQRQITAEPKLSVKEDIMQKKEPLRDEVFDTRPPPTVDTLTGQVVNTTTKSVPMEVRSLRPRIITTTKPETIPNVGKPQQIAKYFEPREEDIGVATRVLRVKTLSAFDQYLKDADLAGLKSSLVKIAKDVSPSEREQLKYLVKEIGAGKSTLEFESKVEQTGALRSYTPQVIKENILSPARVADVVKTIDRSVATTTTKGTKSIAPSQGIDRSAMEQELTSMYTPIEKLKKLPIGKLIDTYKQVTGKEPPTSVLGSEKVRSESITLDYMLSGKPSDIAFVTRPQRYLPTPKITASSSEDYTRVVTKIKKDPTTGESKVYSPGRMEMIKDIQEALSKSPGYKAGDIKTLGKKSLQNVETEWLKHYTVAESSVTRQFKPMKPFDAPSKSTKEIPTGKGSKTLTEQEIKSQERVETRFDVSLRETKAPQEFSSFIKYAEAGFVVPTIARATAPEYRRELYDKPVSVKDIVEGNAVESLLEERRQLLTGAGGITSTTEKIGKERGQRLREINKVLRDMGVNVSTRSRGSAISSASPEPYYQGEGRTVGIAYDPVIGYRDIFTGEEVEQGRRGKPPGFRPIPRDVLGESPEFRVGPTSREGITPITGPRSGVTPITGQKVTPITGQKVIPKFTTPEITIPKEPVPTKNVPREEIIPTPLLPPLFPPQSGAPGSDYDPQRYRQYKWKVFIDPETLLKFKDPVLGELGAGGGSVSVSGKTGVKNVKTGFGTFDVDKGGDVLLTEEQKNLFESGIMNSPLTLRVKEAGKASGEPRVVMYREGGSSRARTSAGEVLIEERDLNKGVKPYRESGGRRRTSGEKPKVTREDMMKVNPYKEGRGGKRISLGSKPTTTEEDMMKVKMFREEGGIGNNKKKKKITSGEKPFADRNADNVTRFLEGGKRDLRSGEKPFALRNDNKVKLLKGGPIKGKKVPIKDPITGKTIPFGLGMKKLKM